MEAEAGPPLLSNCIEHTAPCWFLPFHSIAVRTVQSKKAAEVSVGKKLRWKTLWVAVERQLQRGSCQLVVCKLLEKLLLKLAVILLKHRFCGAPETTLKLCNNLEKLTHAHTHTQFMHFYANYFWVNRRFSQSTSWPQTLQKTNTDL